MSWKASAWAKDQRLGSPSAKSILMCLADYADPAGVILGWASQSELADAAEVSERTAREWLQRLEDWGLVERQRQQRPNGARAADLIVLRLDRKVTDGAERCRRLKEGEEGADPDGEGAGGENLPAESAGRSNRQMDAEPTGNQAQPTGNQFRAYKEEPPISPPYPSQGECAQAREREEVFSSEGQEEGPSPAASKAALERRFWKLVKAHPDSAGMPKKGWLAEWLKLDAEAQERAERRHGSWLAVLKAQSRKHIPALKTYFADRLFDEVADPGEAGDAPQDAVAPAFGPLWAAWRAAKLLGEAPQAGPPPPAGSFVAQLLAQDDQAGRRSRLERQARFGWPVVNRCHELAENRRGLTIAAERAAALEPLAGLTEFVPAGSAVFEAWRAEHERRGWPFVPDPGRLGGAYFPRGGPEGLPAFEDAVKATAASSAAGKQEKAA